MLSERQVTSSMSTKSGRGHTDHLLSGLQGGLWQVFAAQKLPGVPQCHALQRLGGNCPRPFSTFPLPGCPGSPLNLLCMFIEMGVSTVAQESDGWHGCRNTPGGQPAFRNALSRFLEHATPRLPLP